jgi:hypothetical protein
MFTDSNNGYAVGWEGVIIRTTDGGITWNSQSSNTFNTLTDISFANQNLGIAVGWSGTIIKTTDAGLNWDIQNSGTNNYLWGVSYIDSIHATSVGYQGTILNTKKGGLNFIEEENNSIQLKKFLLEQNYPNPFNPSTSIQYAISSAQFVTLKVYDLLGREVATLVNEEKTAGSYNVEFRMQNLELSSGIYFYKLQAGDFVETKKMILLK